MISLIIAVFILYIAICIGVVIWSALAQAWGGIGWFLGLGILVLLIMLAV